MGNNRLIRTVACCRVRISAFVISNVFIQHKSYSRKPEEVSQCSRHLMPLYNAISII